MKICCWNCEFYEYDEGWDGEEETRDYRCHHPKGNGVCTLPKYGAEEGDCPLLDAALDTNSAANRVVSAIADKPPRDCLEPGTQETLVADRIQEDGCS